MNYRNKANLTLIIVTILFIMSIVLKHFFYGSLAVNGLIFVLEAALVGGIADWFAVTAIFRRPLGIKYHTALIPENRKIVIDSIAGMVENELLSVKSIGKKLDDIDFSGILIEFAEKIIKNDDHKVMTDFINGFRDNYLNELSDSAGHVLQDIDFLPVAKKISAYIINSNLWDYIYSFLIDQIIKYVNSPDVLNNIFNMLREIEQQNSKSGIKKLGAKFLETTNSINITDASEAIQQSCVETAGTLKEKNNALSEKIRKVVFKAFADFDTTDAAADIILNFKENALNNADFKNSLNKLVICLYESLTSDRSIDLIYDDLVQGYNSFKENEDYKSRVNSQLKQLLNFVVLSQKHLIGSIVKETLSEFSDQDLNNMIEEKVGNDLQWIRINGSVVGGMVGFLLYILMTFVLKPYIVPFISRLF